MATGKAKVLFIGTNYGGVIGKGTPKERKTGSYVPEVAHLYVPMIKVFDIDYATPLGGENPLDENSFVTGADDPISQAWLKVMKLLNTLAKTLLLQNMKAEDYVAVVVPGGHGPIYDLPQNADVQRIIGQVYDNGGVVVALCHGPSALLEVKLKNGEYLLKGKQMTSYSIAEEKLSDFDKEVPILIEQVAQERGAIYFRNQQETRGPTVIADGRLVTGQNPASALPLAEKAIEVILENLKK